MKKFGLLLGLLLVSAAQLSAQVTVRLSLEQDQFLPGESLPVDVRITNRSGQTLHLGREEAWLTFSIQSHDGHLVVPQASVPVVGAFTLNSSMVAIKRVNLAPYFRLVDPGHYTVTASVFIKSWQKRISSQTKGFDIIQGAKLWQQEVGMPNPPGESNAPPRIRIYTLQQANYLSSNLMLYLQVTDNTGKIYKVVRIGQMLSFGQPEPQVDRQSNLHVLYQNGPKSFSYTVYDPDGKLIKRQTYAYTTRPRLESDGNGNILVVGGPRVVTANDVPPPKVDEAQAGPSATQTK